MIRKIFLVDSFVDGPFTGAPTSVVFLRSPLEKIKMARIAAEVGSQEAVFILWADESFLLRFFSQTQEIPLSIHACLAGAHLIYEIGLCPPAKPLRLHTQEGEVVASLAPESGLISLTASSQLLTKLDQTRLETFRALLSLEARDVAWGALTPQKVVILSVERPELIKSLEISLDGLLKAPALGLAVTSPAAGGDADFHLRTFLPALGVNEEHVSGSVHRSLAPQWSRLLQKKRLICRQLSPRGGLVFLDLVNPGQVSFSGLARTFFKGVLKSGYFEE
ncbi:MAG: PhzF family phenazine biosynthesis protein [Deltaproteobacteria bacterium]|jgi:PhzF family phenazine biosynthesis protein|nr:PhzF family phenazine biosynthesis protein [Deltaproteobacteria bacterium]